jgi:hypothetical protein
MQASTACVICDYWHTTFGTVPKSLVDFNILISCAIMLPFTYPILEHLPSVSICDRHFFYCIDFKRWCMQHLLDSTWSRLKNCESDHLIQPNLWDLLLYRLIVTSLTSRIVTFLLECFKSIRIVCAESWRLTKQMFLWSVLKDFC